MAEVSSSRSSHRIPATLQSVFLASNRGKEVYRPPPERVASKVFFRNWFFQRKPGSNRKGGWRNKETSENGDENAGRSALSTKATTPSCIPLAPQAYLDAMIKSRGYSTKRYKSLQSAYHNKPTPLQQASYHVHIVELVRKHDLESFASIMSSGISPNPCNSYGESLLHMVCRRGEHELLQIMIDNNCTIQVTDDYGRTPLHDACWASKPVFETIDLIVRRDARLFHMVDCRGAAPLSYVRKEFWPLWVEYLEGHKDIYWPVRDVTVDGEQQAPPLTMLEANSCPVLDPPHALTLELASMVASGRMEPEEARFLLRDSTENATGELTENFSDDSYDSDYDDSESCCSDDTFDENEMADILTNLTALNASSSLAWSSH